MTRPASGTRPRPSKGYRWLLVSSLVTLAALLPAALGWLYFYLDGSAPDDADLFVEIPIVKPEENGYLVLLKSGLKEVSPDRDLSEKDYEELSAVVKADIAGGQAEVGNDPSFADDLWIAWQRIRRGDAWYPSLVRVVFDKNAAFLERVEECLKLPSFQITVEIPNESIGPFIGFVEDFGILRARAFAREGKTEEAIEESLKLLRLAWKIRTSARQTLDLGYARSLETRAMENLLALLMDSEVSEDSLRRLRDELSIEGDAVETARRAILGWYGVVARWLDGLAATENPPPPGVDCPIPKPWNSWQFLLPNSTRALLAEAARTCYANAGRPVKDRAPFVAQPCVYEGWARFVPVRNGMGKFTVFFWTRALWWVEIDEPRILARRRLIATWLALKLYLRQHATLPADLDSLVPRYLPSVPIDPYDGKPLRYSAEKRTIYSIGSDLEDSGGTDGADFKKALYDSPDPTLRLDVSFN